MSKIKYLESRQEDLNRMCENLIKQNESLKSQIVELKRQSQISDTVTREVHNTALAKIKSQDAYIYALEKKIEKEHNQRGAGRKPMVDKATIIEARASGMKIKDIAVKFCISVATVNRLVKKQIY